MKTRRVRRRDFTLGALVIFGAGGRLRAAQAGSDQQHVLCAGGNEVFVLDLAEAARGKVDKLWKWSAQSDPTLPDERRRWFGNLDECKPVDGGKRVLVCASNSGCGLIDRATGTLAWHASVTNAHSVEMLPNERVVAASSLSGDKLALFDLQSDRATQPVWTTPLHSAHGLVWDEPRRVLWALGFNELRKYSLADWDTASPSLNLEERHEIPWLDGHDLRPVPQSDDLIMTTEGVVGLFDRQTKRFRAHPTAGSLAKVKAIDVHPITGRVVYSTWGKKLSLLDPKATIALDGNTVYKVRWLEPASNKRAIS